MIETYIEQSAKKWRRMLLVLLSLLILVIIASLAIGSVYISPGFFWDYLTGASQNPVWENILLNFRVPKALTAVLAGSALAVSGLQMQTVFRNPMAGPFILGISSGAGLGVALVIFLGVLFGGIFEWTGLGRSWLLVSSSAIGSFLVLSVVLFASYRIKSSIALLILGLMFGSAASAFVSILQYFSQAENIQAYIIWSFGSLGSLSWVQLYIMMPIIMLSLLFSIVLSKPLNLMLLGESYAESSGLNLKQTRTLILVNTSLLAGTVTAFCGPIACIGLAIPHIARMFFNTGNHLLLSPLAMILGGLFLLVFDLIAQLPGSEATLPINAITSLFGAPFVIWLILRKANLNYSFQ